MPRFIVGFDLGGTKMLAALMTRKFKVKQTHRQKINVNDDGDKLYKQIVATICKTLENEGINQDHLDGIGIGSPGPLDPATGVIMDPPNLPMEKFSTGRKTLERIRL